MAKKKTDAVVTTPESTPAMTPEQCRTSGEPFVVRYNLANGTCTAIVVDVPNKMIQFCRCHRPRRFLSWGKAAENVVCRFDEIEAYYRSSIKGNTFLKIVTTSGTATISHHARGFDELWSWLNGNITFNPAAHPEDSPLMLHAYAWGAAVGMFGLPVLLCLLLGLPVHEVHVSIGVVVLCMLGCGLVGVALMHALVKIVGRVLKTSLVPAIVYGFACGFAGSICGTFLSIRFLHPGSTAQFIGCVVGFVAVGFATGVLVGTIRDARSRRSARMRVEARRGESSHGK
ncbi:MAG: hypothetical protein ABSF26_01935 [Thermoguttaceae bacterium]